MNYKIINENFSMQMNDMRNGENEQSNPNDNEEKNDHKGIENLQNQPSDYPELEKFEESIKNADLEEVKDINEEKDVDYGKYDQVRTDYPVFRQLHNSCGLSSMLVFLDPDSNEDLQNFLNMIWEKISQIVLQKPPPLKEFQWSFVLEYLLLKSICLEDKNELYNRIGKIEPYNFDLFRPMLNFKLEGYMNEYIEKEMELFPDIYQRFFDEGIINQFILLRHLDEMKDQWELVPLFSLFGYELIPYDSPDGMGAIFFTKKDLKHPNAQISENLKKLKKEFDMGARIIYGMRGHWMPVTNIILTKSGYKITFNDSNTARKISIPMKRLPESNWFYIFRKKKDVQISDWNEILKWLNPEFERELEDFINFKKLLREQAMKKLKLQPQTTDVVKLEVDGSIKQDSEPRPILTGDKFIENIRKIIKAHFSDYTEL